MVFNGGLVVRVLLWGWGFCWPVDSLKELPLQQQKCVCGQENAASLSLSLSLCLSLSLSVSLYVWSQLAKARQHTHRCPDRLDADLNLPLFESLRCGCDFSSFLSEFASNLVAISLASCDLNRDLMRFKIAAIWIAILQFAGGPGLVRFRYGLGVWSGSSDSGFRSGVLTLWRRLLLCLSTVRGMVPVPVWVPEKRFRQFRLRVQFPGKSGTNGSGFQFPFGSWARAQISGKKNQETRRGPEIHG